MLSDEVFGFLIPGPCEPEQGAGQYLVGSPALDGVDGPLGLDAAPGLCGTQYDQTPVARRLGHERAMAGHDELHLWERSPQAEPDFALPNRMEMSVDLVDQDHAFDCDPGLTTVVVNPATEAMLQRVHAWCICDGRGVTGARRVVIEASQDIDGQRQEAAIAVTEFQGGHLSAAETVKDDALGVDRFDADSSRQEAVDHPPNRVERTLCAIWRGGAGRSNGCRAYSTIRCNREGQPPHETASRIAIPCRG